MTRMFAALRWPLGAVVLAVLALVPLSVARAADAPLELAGLRLGQIVDDVADKLVGTGVDRVIHRPYIGVMPMAAVPGYRSGYVDFGLCAKPGRIVRIKMNYADDSLAFFTKVMEALKKRYGEPSQWRGNAFGTLRTWKWGLRTRDGQPVSLILMHYEGEDGAFTDGNSIRIAATDMVREEEQCHAAQSRHDRAARGGKKAEPDVSSLGPDWFLPR